MVVAAAAGCQSSGAHASGGVEVTEPAAASYARRMANAWFESIEVAQRRARRRLPKSVYMALVAGADAGSRSPTMSPPSASSACDRSPPASPPHVT